MSWMRWSAWLFFAATLYLILAEAISPWIALPSLGNIGFTLIFVLFALTHCAAVQGTARTAAFFSVSAVISYLMEESVFAQGRFTVSIITAIDWAQSSGMSHSSFRWPGS